MMEELYRNNYDFKTYVDKYVVSMSHAMNKSISLQQALEHAEVKNYAEYLAERGDGETKLRNMWGKTAGAAHENVAEV